MRVDWTALDAELAHWSQDGLVLPLWWRDDDATRPTEDLSHLAEMARSLDLPVHLAVIPSGAADTLAPVIRDTPYLVPVVHGWAHVNHAPAGQKKAEFGAHRPVNQMVPEITEGYLGLKQLLGPDLVPMFVPPWNRIAPDLAAVLQDLGFGVLSTFGPRKRRFPAPGLEQINTHLDPINWKGDRGLVPPSRLIAQLTQDLFNRRAGVTDNAEPYGILTHHLVHDKDIWTFTHALLTRLLAGPAQAWRASRAPRR